MSAKPIELYYLIFDDDTEAENQHRREVIVPGCDCIPVFINPIDHYDAEHDTYNTEALICEIKEKTQGKNIALVVSDWNILSKTNRFKGLVGWDIIKLVIQAKDKLKSRPFLLYSANINKASEYILEKIKEEIDSKEDITSLEFIKDLLELKIKFYKRNEERFNEVITQLKQSNTISDIVLNSVCKFDQNMVVNTGNKDFDGKVISELLEHNNIKGLKFIREFIDLAIAHYTELNA